MTRKMSARRRFGIKVGVEGRGGPRTRWKKNKQTTREKGKLTFLGTRVFFGTCYWVKFGSDDKRSDRFSKVPHPQLINS